MVGPGAADPEVEVPAGGELTGMQRLSDSVWELTITPPRPLRRDEEHDLEIVAGAAEVLPYAVRSSVRPCSHFRIRSTSGIRVPPTSSSWPGCPGAYSVTTSPAAAPCRSSTARSSETFWSPCRGWPTASAGGSPSPEPSDRAVSPRKWLTVSVAVELDKWMLIGSVVVLVAIISSRIGSRLGLPSLLLFLGLGMALDLSLGIDFHDAKLGHALGFAALVLILAEGGLTTRWVEIKGSVPVASLFATVGMAVSVGVMTLFGVFVLGLDPWLAVLLGAVCSPTDSAAVFSVLRTVPLPARLRSALEAESGLNDAPTVLLVVEASRIASGGHSGGLGDLVLLVGLELTGGVVLGVVLGWLGVKILRNVNLPSSALYSIAALVWAVMAYGLGVQLYLSGFAAVYVCAVVLGNGQLPHRIATRSFVEGIGWIAQIGLFIMLGLLAAPNRLTPEIVGVGVLSGLVLTLVARPLSVWACAVWFRIPLRHQAFLSWAGLRGAVPIILATIPLSAGVPGAQWLFDVVLVFVVVFTVLQAPTLPFAARVLGVEESGPTDVEVEAAPIERIKADLLQIRIPEGSRLAGVAVSELRLPKDSVVSLIIRDGVPFAPSGRTILRLDDEILIVTPSKSRMIAEKRLRELGQGGRLAKWRRGLAPVEPGDVD